MLVSVIMHLFYERYSLRASGCMWINKRCVDEMSLVFCGSYSTLVCILKDG